MTITEFLSFNASEAYLKKQALFQEELPEINGLLSSLHGIQVEDGITVYGFFEWETLQHHKDLQNDIQYAPLIAELKLATATKPEILHVEFTRSPSHAMSAPITEVVRYTLKEGKSKEDFATLLDSLSNDREGAKEAYPPLAWGPILEKEDTFVQLTGWESIEATEAVRAIPDLKGIIGPLSEFADMEVSHVKLRH